MHKNTITIILSAIIIVLMAIILSKVLKDKPQAGIVSLEEIRKIREFHVVSYRFEDLFFYHNKQDQGKRVVAIASVPVTLQAYFDMREADIMHTDSLLILKLPAASLTEPSYAFDEMKTKSVRRFSVVAGVDIHEKMLISLREKVAGRKQNILAQAEESGIRKMAKEQAEEYFMNFFNSLGYQSVAIEVKTNTGIDSLLRKDEDDIIGLEGITLLE